jgi:hypothetical protein
MRVVPFKPEHLSHLPLQRKQLNAREYIANDPDYIRALTMYGDAYTVLVDGEPIVCAGVMKYGDGRGGAWALFAETSGKHFVRICRYILRYLQVSDLRRIEAVVDVDFAEGIRLAKVLGFKVEGVMQQYGRDGHDHYMMGRV